MDSAIDMSSARELVSDEALWPLVRRFLWDFASEVHPSWIEDLDAEVEGHRLISEDLASPRVKSYILESLGVVPCFHTFPKGDWSRLLLVEGSTLVEICKWLGALVCAAPLRLVTSGAMVRELKASLAGVYPEVFSFTAYFRLKTEGFKVEDLKVEGPKDVIGIGWQVLKSYVSGLSDPLKSRFELKLPKSYRDLQAPSFKPSTINLQLLLKLRFPEVYSLCC